MLSRAYKEHQVKQAAHREKQGKLNVPSWHFKKI